uniref:Uncharacterized protein n=1 Tax=Ditylenchus dipsaci TaxID=166011 RepID=A0A915CYG4_9BILA
MALIYASAINKRVNNMPVKSKRSSVEAATSSSSVVHQQLQKHSEHVLPASSAFHHIKQRSNEETHRVDNRRGHSTDNNHYDTPPPTLPKRCISHCSCSVCAET